MYRVIVMLCILMGLLSCNSDKKTVRLKGELKNFSTKVMLENRSLEGSLLEKKIAFELNDQNQFELSIELDKPNYYRLGRNTLYLSPGDDIQLYCDRDNPMAARFIGEGAEACTYLRSKPFSKRGSYLESGRLIEDKPSLAEVLKRVDAKVKKRLKELEETNDVSEHFRKLEHGRIMFDAVNSLLFYPVYSMAGEKISGAERTKLWKEILAVFEKDFRKYLVNLSGVDYLDIDVYRDISRSCLPYLQSEETISEIQDFIKTRMFLASLSASGPILRNMAEKSRVTNDLRIDYYKEIISKSFKKYDHLTPGKPAPEVELKNSKGEKVMLSNFKGKLLLIDVWATWCGPCIAESPFFEKLAEKYKEEDVEFIAVSIDPNKKSWEKYLAKHPKTTKQFITSKSDLAPYLVEGIPRIIVIDKNGLVVDAFATRPSDPKLEKLIKNKL